MSQVKKLIILNDKIVEIVEVVEMLLFLHTATQLSKCVLLRTNYITIYYKPTLSDNL